MDYLLLRKLLIMNKSISHGISRQKKRKRRLNMIVLPKTS